MAPTDPSVSTQALHHLDIAIPLFVGLTPILVAILTYKFAVRIETRRANKQTLAELRLGWSNFYMAHSRVLMYNYNSIHRYQLTHQCMQLQASEPATPEDRDRVQKELLFLGDLIKDFDAEQSTASRIRQAMDDASGLASACYYVEALEFCSRRRYYLKLLEQTSTAAAALANSYSFTGNPELERRYLDVGVIAKSIFEAVAVSLGSASWNENPLRLGGRSNIASRLPADLRTFEKNIQDHINFARACRNGQ